MCKVQSIVYWNILFQTVDVSMFGTVNLAGVLMVNIQTKNSVCSLLTCKLYFISEGKGDMQVTGLPEE